MSKQELQDDALDAVFVAVQAALDAGCGNGDVMTVATKAAQWWHLEANDRTDEIERSRGR